MTPAATAPEGVVAPPAPPRCSLPPDFLEAVFGAVPDGLLVVDPEGRIVGGNAGLAAALRLESPLEPGEPLADVLRRRDVGFVDADVAIAALENASDGIVLCDDAGRITDVNRAICELLNRSAAEVVGTRITDHMPEEQRSGVSAALLRLAPGAGTILEYDVVGWNGQVVPVEASATRLADGRVLAVVRDVRERRRLAVALELSEARHRRLFEIMAQGVMYRDGNGRVTAANLAALEIVGVPLEAALQESQAQLAQREARSGD